MKSERMDFPITVALSSCFIFPRNNRITAEGAVHLSKGLMLNTALRVLKVSGLIVGNKSFYRE